MKSGIRTTEFYITLGTQIIAILVLLGIFSPDDAIGANETWGKAVEAAAALVASALVAWKYIEARARIKAAGK